MRRLSEYRVRRNQSGDTIVEVLIAISIVSLVLTSAYMVTNKNAQTMRAVQEKTQAQKLVERQVELLKGSTNVPSDGGCYTDDIGSVSTNPSLECYFDGTGLPSPSSDGSARYKISITTSTAPTYKIQSTWDKLGGGTGNVTMYYYEKKN